MSRSAYGSRECDYCNRWISNAGFAWASHMRKHVREGLVTERKQINYSNRERAFGVYLRFVPTDEGVLARNKVLRERRRSAQAGQGLLEYALLIVLVALVVIVLLAILGPAVGNMFSNIISNI